jgi:hypothetical protein
VSALNGIGWDDKLARILNVDDNLAAARAANIANSTERVASFLEVHLGAEFNRAQFNIHGSLLSA